MPSSSAKRRIRSRKRQSLLPAATQYDFFSYDSRDASNENGLKKGLTLILSMFPLGHLGLDKYYVGKYVLLGIFMLLCALLGFFVNRLFLVFNNIVIFVFSLDLIYSIFSNTPPFIYGGDLEWRSTNRWDIFFAVIAMFIIVIQVVYFFYSLFYTTNTVKEEEEQQQKEEERLKELNEKEKQEQDEYLKDYWNDYYKE